MGTIQEDKTEYLFSYGTLRYENVQLTTFGRRLEGCTDYLQGYSINTVKITDPEVIARSGEDVHSIIEYSGKGEDRVPGMVFKVSQAELLNADAYEVDDYQRIKVKLGSGLDAWVYVSAQCRAAITH